MDCGTSGTDIYFNFIGSYYPPCETISEEERIAAIDAEQLRKKQEKGKRASERQQQKLKALRESAKAGDPEAAARYEEHLRKQRERNHRYRQQVQQARAADPEYLRQLDEKERLKQERLLEKERKRSERSAQRAKLTRAELKEKAKTDPGSRCKVGRSKGQGGRSPAAQKGAGRSPDGSRPGICRHDGRA